MWKIHQGWRGGRAKTIMQYERLCLLLPAGHLTLVNMRSKHSFCFKLILRPSHTGGETNKRENAKCWDQNSGSNTD